MCIDCTELPEWADDNSGFGVLTASDVGTIERALTAPGDELDYSVFHEDAE